MCKRYDQDVVLLHCIAGYPAPIIDSNLKRINYLKKKYMVDVGLSDHSLGHNVAAASINLGACMVEKHFTLSRNDGGFDSKFSLEPSEFSKMIDECNIAHQILGEETYGYLETEDVTRSNKRSLYAIQDISVGELLSKKNIKSIRPGLGLSPKYLTSILGKIAKKNIKFGEPIDPSMF